MDSSRDCPSTRSLLLVIQPNRQEIVSWCDYFPWLMYIGHCHQRFTPFLGTSIAKIVLIHHWS